MRIRNHPSDLPILALVLTVASFVLPLAEIQLPAPAPAPAQALHWTQLAASLVFAVCGLLASTLAALGGLTSRARTLFFSALGLLASLAPISLLAAGVGGLLDPAGWRSGFWCYLSALFLLAVVSVRQLAAQDGDGPWARYGTPLLFGAWLLIFWQLLTESLGVPKVLLPAPSVVWQSFVSNFGVLAGDFVQTVLHAVLIGLAAGAALGFAVGVAIDRSPFLQRGLLPIAALASTVPLVGIAPIMVMWFGFDWHSKAAVVVVMTFFPMLVNALAGLAESGHMERDLMRSYGASYWRTLWSLRLPVALPFVFNALKIDSTLALIGAIVAEFFGSPTEGLGFRISTEAARLNMGLVWAAIGVAALTGSTLYAALAGIERAATFWHPSMRSA